MGRDTITGLVVLAMSLALSWATLGLERQVCLDLILEIALRSTADHQAFSGVVPGSITRAMDSTRRFHRPASTVSCFRPTAVSA